jgi:hypothetical protein
MRFASQVMKGYVNAIRSANVGRADELKCLAIVGKKFKQPTRMLRGW